MTTAATTDLAACLALVEPGKNGIYSYCSAEVASAAAALFHHHGDTLQRALALLAAVESGLYVVVNIGCIECGVSSDIVGLFSDQKLADEAAERLEESHSLRQGGQNAFEVYRLPTDFNVCAPEYAAPEAPGVEG